ncbi:hypothetical protein [Ruminococcus sp.]|uniref:hypothetical protein n=1 Tax=Ruminococcus sp. TaxID=41978 RepID=UPI003868B802
MQFILSYSVFFVNAFRTGDRDFAAVGRSGTDLLKGCARKARYDEIISWLSVYDSASIEAKKMIVNSMIKRVDVYRNYDLNIELNMNIRRFFLGMEETESYPITA